jgi:hypothetical protein
MPGRCVNPPNVAPKMRHQRSTIRRPGVALHGS